MRSGRFKNLWLRSHTTALVAVATGLCLLAPGPLAFTTERTAATASRDHEVPKEVPEAFSAVLAAREADRAPTQLRAELREKWNAYLHTHGIDEGLDKATTVRLKDEYFQAIEAWGQATEACEPDGVNRRWLPRLLKAFTRDDVLRQRDDIARILGALANQRLSDCSQEAQERALRAERELNAFVGERLRVLLDFFESLEPGSIRGSSKSRIARLEKGLKAQRPLADRSVSVAALRLRTAAAQADPALVEHLEEDPSFQKPFVLRKALAQLNGLDRSGPSARPSSGASEAAKTKRDEASKIAVDKPLKPAPDVPHEEPQDFSPRFRQPKTSPTPSNEPLTTPWLLQ